MQELFRDFLKPEANEILNNLDNYLRRYEYTDPSICGYCKKEIKTSFLPLIVWNKDQEYYIEFYIECGIKGEKLEDFLDFIDEFDFINEFNE